jgi:gamma-glutamyltranspeptidase/glutathione hydrolase
MPETGEITGKVIDRSAVGTQTMAATAFPAASEAAVEILKAGGNAVDAAVAAAWALSVCEPSGSGLGGQTTLLISTPDGKTTVLDGHSYAPEAVSLRTVSPRQQRWGYRASTIPSTPATLGAALDRFGSLPLQQVLAPAIRLAEEGFPVTNLMRLHIRWCKSTLENCPFVARIFLPRGRPPARGKTLRQAKLARTLKKLAERGAEDFYRGGIARAIVRDMRRNGGLLTADDLASFDMPVEMQPLSASYRGHRVITVPPPGGGLQLLLGLKILEYLDFHENIGHPDAHETMALTINALFRERERLPLYPDLMTPSQLAWLLSDDRAAEVAASLRAKYNFEPMMDEEEPGETTHLSVVDSNGMAVALTQSIQSLFGAKFANEKLGFFYNNYLCTCPRFQHPYQLKSRAMPQSNVAPTMVFPGVGEAEENTPELILGAAGSRRITSSILQVISNFLDGGMSLQQAVDAPRVHALLSGKVLLEGRLHEESLKEQLAQYFDRIQIKADRSHAMGAVQAVARDDDGNWIGVADPRREGRALGY